MSENPSLSERVAALEKASTVRGRISRRRTMTLLGIALVLFGINVWLAVRLAARHQFAAQSHAFWVVCQAGHTAAERQAAFQQLVAAGNKEWRSAHLTDLQLAGISLPAADLVHANLQGANFSKANLARVRLIKGSLERADLTSANLDGADLSETQFFRATLRDATLQRAKLRAAFMQEIAAENADLRLADASEADLLMANLAGANLAGADLTGARLEAASFHGANLSLAQLSGANLKDADFGDSNWWRARGLTSAQIDLLKRKFPPTQKAPAKLHDDFREWTMRPAN